MHTTYRTYFSFHRVHFSLFRYKGSTRRITLLVSYPYGEAMLASFYPEKVMEF